MRCKTHAVYNQTLVWKLDGTVISNSISYKKLRLLEVATNYIGSEGAIPPMTKVTGILAPLNEDDEDDKPESKVEEVKIQDDSTETE